MKNRRTFLRDSLYLVGIISSFGPIYSFRSREMRSNDGESFRYRFKLKNRDYGMKTGSLKGKQFLSIRPLQGQNQGRVYTFDLAELEKNHRKKFKDNSLSFQVDGKSYKLYLKKERILGDYPGATFPDPIPPRAEIFMFLIGLAVAVGAAIVIEGLIKSAINKPKESGFILEPDLEQEPGVWY